MDYRYQPPHEFVGWRSGDGTPTPSIQSGEDGAWPREFRQADLYTRAGRIGRRGPEPWEVTVDAFLRPPGSSMEILSQGDGSDAELRNPPGNQPIQVVRFRGRAAVRVDLPLAGMAILA